MTALDVIGAALGLVAYVLHQFFAERRVARVTGAIDRLATSLEHEAQRPAAGDPPAPRH